MDIDGLNRIINRWEANRTNSALGFFWRSDEGEDVREYLKEKYEVDVLYYSHIWGLDPNCRIQIRHK